MKRSFHTEIQRVVLLLSGLLLFGYFNGHMLATLLAGCLGYIAWGFYKFQQIYRWLDGGARGLPPDATGVWGDMSDYLYRLQKRVMRSQHNLKSLTIRIQKITDALSDGILILDRNRSLEWWNPSAELLLSLETDDRHQSIVNLVRDPRFVEFIQQHEFKDSLEIRAPGSISRILACSAAAFGDDEVVLVVRDITRLRNLEEMRKEFVGNVSHELRTPLTVISGYLENLGAMTDMLPKPVTRAMGQMKQQTDRMSSLADDLVMLSKLESLEKHAGKKKVPLEPLLQQVVTDANALSEGKHQITLQGDISLSLRGKQSQIQSAISNLVFNAVRHNPQGCDININAVNNGASFHIDISDTGMGIDPSHLPRLTERFYRVDASRTSNSGGTGLGLAIVKHVMLRHEGSLEIESTLGKGSVFSCRFPKSRVVE
ncbi:phosphate regulon sensor histidine kinase PhoR [bacterium SCSIO 12696]|nr:phosphate regulon sensor histidine kinase PhoR [bacterium SCSIO 12696]